VPAAEATEAAHERDDPFLVEGPIPEPWTDGTTGLCIPYLLGQHSGSVARDGTERPVPTIATRGAIGLYRPQAFVLPRNGYHRGLHSNPAYIPDEQPLHTVTAKNHDGHVVTPYLVPFYSERSGQAPRTHNIDEPLPTVTATGSQPAVTRPYLIQYHGNSGARSIDEPLPTVTTRDSLALCLPEHYPWGLDIRFRMLQPRELAAAMGFPQDYEFAGTKTETVEQIGNAVPVNLATSLCERLLAGRDPTLQSYTSGSGATVADGGNRPRAGE
jgi:DNA (cytosine-5)-methyltransferase 1